MAGVASMSSIKVYALGGMDQKSNDLTRSTEKASDMVNMEFDTQSTTKKRGGYLQQLIDAGYTLPTGTVKDMIYYSDKDEIILFVLDTTIKVYALARSGGNFTSRLLSGTCPYTYSSSAMFPVSHCENQGNFYFTFADSSQLVQKYDGSIVVNAGFLTPYNTYDSRNQIITNDFPVGNGVFIGPTSTTGYFMRVFAKYTDYNGNISYGPYIESPLATSTTLQVKVKNFTNINGYNKYLIVDTTYSGVDVILSAATPTVQVISGYHNYVAGDKLLVIATTPLIQITTPTNVKTLKLEVESVTATSVTFTAASLSGVSITLGYGASINFDRRCEFVVAISKSRDTGYYISSQVSSTNNGLYVFTVRDSVHTFYPDVDGFAEGLLVPFENVYDSTTLKTRPPTCKYLSSFGDQIVYGYVKSITDQNNGVTIYNNNDLVIYSDISTGDGPENISEGNRQKIGETWDGEITGLRRSNDSMIIFKSNGVFSLDGVLAQGQYSLRKINTNFVGCTSDKSIVQSEEGLYFQSHNGIYFTNGINVAKLTYELDSFFLSGTYTGTRGARLKKKQKTMFYVPDMTVGTAKIVVIDYYYNQVYLWSLDKQPSLGLIEDKNGSVYFTDGTKLYMFNDLYSDNGVAISSTYSTTWHHVGEPALNKKWLSLRLFALTSDAYTATITTCGDWDSSRNLTTNTLQFGSTDQTKFLMLDMQTKKSLRVTFANSTDAENMVITGYELTYEMFNVIDKN